MYIAIRISGLVDMASYEEELLFRLRLRRKYSAVIFKENKENYELLKKVRNFVAFGTISKEMLKELIEKRAEPIGGKKIKIDADKIVSELDSKTLEKFGIKPFFRLHPPVGGIDSKKHFPITKKAVLGDNKEKINDLLRRMLV